MPVQTRPPSDLEQSQLELINRARANPAGEVEALLPGGRAADAGVRSAVSYFGVDAAALARQLATVAPVAPLAWSSNLGAAATSHSQLMIQFDSQSHQLPGEASLGNRISASGYSGWRGLSENVFAYAQDSLYAHAGFFIDWGYDTEDRDGSTLRSDWQSRGDGMQDPAGHRNNILNGTMTEVGIAFVAETASGTAVGPFVVTQDFGTRSGYVPQLLGVVIDDTDRDAFYDVGEGLGGVTVTATGAAGVFVTTTWASGGYQMELPRGSYTVSFSGGGLAGQASYAVTMAGTNLKRDAFKADAVAVPEPAPGPGAGDDLVQGTARGGETLSGLGGNDTLFGGGGGNDTLLGGAGHDLLRPVGADPVHDPVAAQVYRLYRATLDRAPDVAGHMDWTGRLIAGRLTLDQAVTGFVNSREFQNIYGAATNGEFVTLLYNNVLDRAPDAGGYAYWLDRLDSGISGRERVVLGFSESAEFRRATDVAALGFSKEGLKAAWADDIYRLYQATLDRDPDAAGLDHWASRMAEGATFLNVVTGFANSAEFKGIYGNMTNSQFVTQLYDTVLDRAPDAASLLSWVGALDSRSLTREQVMQDFARSPELVAVSRPAMVAYLRTVPGEILNGGAGNDTLFGGFAADRFVFDAADDGADRVAGLEAWDGIELAGFGYATRAEALSHMHQQDRDVVFSDAGVEIVFLDTALSMIRDDVQMIFG